MTCHIGQLLYPIDSGHVAGNRIYFSSHVHYHRWLPVGRSRPDHDRPAFDRLADYSASAGWLTTSLGSTPGCVGRDDGQFRRLS